MVMSGQDLHLMSHHQEGGPSSGSFPLIPGEEHHLLTPPPWSSLDFQ